MTENVESRSLALVDAFTTDPLTGNAAGVVPDAEGLDAERMQAVAREVAASETAFVVPSDEADRRVRYFSPSSEVDLCGHATIATHARLFATGTIDAGVHAMETNVGVLDVEVTDDGVVWMTQSEPEIREVDLDYDRLGDALGVDPAALRDVGADLPPAVASTGLPFLVVPVNFLEHLGGADPDDAAITAITDEYGAAGLYAFTFDTLEATSTLHGRAFVPSLGIREDPVTGTASGACGAYLRAFGAFTDDGADDAGGGDDGADEDVDADTDEREAFPDELVFEQGHFLDRPGHVRVRVGDTVRVGGRAVTAFDGSISIPTVETDDIVEA